MGNTDDPFKGLPLESERDFDVDQFKQQQIAVMTACVVWFLVMVVLSVAGAFVVKLIGAILAL